MNIIGGSSNQTEAESEAAASGPNGFYSTLRPCPYCGFVTRSRDEFWEHQGTHEHDGDQSR